MSNIITTTSDKITAINEQSIDKNPAAVYLAMLSPSGRRTQKQALDSMAGMLSGNSDCFAFPWQEIRYQHAASIRTRLLDSYKPATVNKYLSALRGVMKHAWRLGHINAEDYQKVADIQSVIGETIPAGRELSAGEISAIIHSCIGDESIAGIRDAAIFAILYGAGLRREEIVNLNITDYDFDSGRLIIQGKRNKERTVYIGGGFAEALGDWLSIRGKEDGPMFYPVNKGGKMKPGRLTPQAIYNLLNKRAEHAGVQKFSPHDIRRTFVSDLLDAGADIATVAKMAGHANIQTTARYDRRPEQAKQKAASLLHIPYKGRI